MVASGQREARSLWISRKRFIRLEEPTELGDRNESAALSGLKFFTKQSRGQCFATLALAPGYLLTAPSALGCYFSPRLRRSAATSHGAFGARLLLLTAAPALGCYFSPRLRRSFVSPRAGGGGSFVLRGWL
jgi:hypothetical protein